MRQRLAALQAQVGALTATVARLQEQLAGARKDSSTSSKPPSSDLVKPAKAAPADGAPPRRPGGQPGHPRHERPPFPPAQRNGGSHTHSLELCPTCGHGRRDIGAGARVVQQVDIQDTPLLIQEHRSVAGYCPHCQALHYAPLPAGSEHGGLVGPRLTALIAYLKGGCHASYSTIRNFLRDVVRVTISRGQRAKALARVSQALDAPYQELLDRLPGAARLNVDATGHPERGERWWTGCSRAGLYTLFKIDPTRSGDVPLAVLGAEFDGVLGCDYFSAYRRSPRECGVVVQFRRAHLVRDVKFLTALPDPRERAYGERLRQAPRGLFGVSHRREQLSDPASAAALRAARDAVLRVATTDVPPARPGRNLAKRFEAHGQAYFEFVTTPGVEPTNNLAEQATRFVVIDRHITQGARGEAGRRWCERIWTAVATCAQQGRSVFEYLSAAVSAAVRGTAVPSLLGNGS